MHKVLAVILAGGKGTRLDPLTRDRAKPAVPFGGSYRIIDFSLSNCLNSGIRRMLVLTQYKAMSLDRHINLGWRRYFCRELGELIDVVPPQQRIDENWYQGTADAVYQNIYAIEQEKPEYVVVLAGDHIYKMNYTRMVDFHRENNADLTIGALRVGARQAHQFGVMEIDPTQRIVGFEEKPPEPKTMPGDPGHCLASMGIYVFRAEFLFEQLCQDATRSDSSHDFGPHYSCGDFVAPGIRVSLPRRKQERGLVLCDVGTLDAYYEANMDLVSIDPELNLYDDRWPIRTYQHNLPPPKFVFSGMDNEDRCGHALDSIVCEGTIISGGLVKRSIIGPKVRVNSYARVQDSILFSGVDIGRHARVRRAIIDKGVCVPAEVEIGYDLKLDRQRGFTVTEKGVVVIAKAAGVEHLVHKALQPETSAVEM